MRDAAVTMHRPLQNIFGRAGGVCMSLRGKDLGGGRRMARTLWYLYVGNRHPKTATLL